MTLKQRLHDGLGPRSFGRFVLIGVLNTSVDVVAFNLILLAAGDVSKTTVALARIVAGTIAIGNSFIWNSLWVFRGHGRPVLRSLILFVILTIAGLATSTAIAAGTYSWLSSEVSRWLAANLGLLAAVAFNAAWNFMTYRSIVFKLKG